MVVMETQEELEGEEGEGYTMYSCIKFSKQNKNRAPQANPLKEKVR